MDLDLQHQLILDFIEKTNRPIFLTGKAGTGKTTFLRYIRGSTKKNLAVLAPTAVAAINAGGATIHSFFQVPFGPVLPPADPSPFAEFSAKSFGSEKSKLIKCLDLLIIDEISMVRADTIDYIDRALRFVKGNSRPFGGVQLLLIGDLYQLPPVFQNDWHLLGRFYKGPYFFDSLVFRACPLLTFELSKVHRQRDPKFIEILNDIRNGSISTALLSELNSHYRSERDTKDLAAHVTLTTHNPLVRQINEQRLEQLPGLPHVFKAKVTGEFPAEAFPAEEELTLKTGAMVMFIKNDSSGKKQFYNGRTATVADIKGDTIKVIFLDDGTPFEVVAETWENTKYTLSESDQKVSQTSAGTFVQFPLRLAWAITIHKSQGLTFDKAVVDVGAAFAHGQTYVALSRCRSLDGLVLKQKVNAQNIITDPAVRTFLQQAQVQVPGPEVLERFIAAERQESLISSFDFGSMIHTYTHFKSVLLELLPNEPQLMGTLNTTTDLLANKIYTVAKRFIQKELTNATFEQSVDQERLKKAAGYFLPHLEQLMQDILSLHHIAEGTPFHPDYFPTLNLLLEMLQTKNKVFGLFTVAGDDQGLKEVWKTAATNYRYIDSWKKIEKATEIENPALYRQLIEWRAEVARQKKVLAHQLLSDNNLVDIAAKLPRSLSALAKIRNMGEGKASAYGNDILKIVKGHLGENDLFG